MTAVMVIVPLLYVLQGLWATLSYAVTYRGLERPRWWVPVTGTAALAFMLIGERLPRSWVVEKTK